MNKKLLITFFSLMLTVTSIILAQSPDEFKIEQLPNGTIKILGFLDTQKKRGDTLVIPSRISGISVTSIGDDAFYFQLQRSASPTFPNGLETIILPDTLREIGDNAFSHFTQQRGGKLDGLVIPRSVTKIGDSAFFDATRQSSAQILVLPSSVKEVGVCAFYSWNIGELYIESVFQIIGKPLGYGEEPFSSINSSSLQKITFPANWPDSTLVKLGLPTGFINYYKSQGKKAGTYVRNGQLWLYSGPASSPPDPRSTTIVSGQNSSNSNTVTQPQQNNAVTFFEQGNTYFNNGEYDKAIAEYNKAIQLNPKFVDAFINRGNIYYNNKQDYNKAIEDYTQAIRIDPNNALAYLNRGNAYFVKQDYDKAIADYTQAIRLDPNNANAFLLRGNTYFVKQDYNKAIYDYTQVIRIDPNNLDAYLYRGNAYFVKEGYDRAIVDYTQVIRLDPNNEKYKQGLEIIQQRGKSSATFPKGFEGTWKRDNFNNTLTFTTNTLKSSSQNYSWILISLSGDTYTYYPDNNPSYSFTPTIKLVKGEIVISGDSGDGQDNWNGTWKKQKR